MSDFLQWVTHGIKRGRFEMGSRTVLYLFLLFIVLTLVAASYLMLISRTAARGRHVEQLRAELFQLQRENEQLEVDIAREGSLSRLWERAIELGFAPAEQVEFLSVAGSVSEGKEQ
jgi:cell division protein FtsL